MNIGEASKPTGLPPKTLRYYEDIKLVVADRRPTDIDIFPKNMFIN